MLGKSGGPGKSAARNSATACGWASGAGSEKLHHDQLLSPPPQVPPVPPHIPPSRLAGGLSSCIKPPQDIYTGTLSLLNASFQIPHAQPLAYSYSPPAIRHTRSLFLTLPFFFSGALSTFSCTVEILDSFCCIFIFVFIC